MFWLFSLPLGVFVSGVLLLRWAQQPQADRTVQRRLDAISRSQRTLDELGLKVLDLEGVKDRNTRLVEALTRHSATAWCPRLLRESGSTWSVFRFFMFTLSGAIVLGVSAALLRSGGALITTCAAAGSMMPCLLLRGRRKRRLARFEAVLPETIDLLSRALQAGHSVQQSIEAASEQAPEPIRAELGSVHQELSLGLPLRDTLLNLLARVPSQDLRFCVTAILLQRQTGGDLVHILDRTAHTVRERLRVEGEVKTFTAQGRFASSILTVLPVALFAITMLITPAYASLLLHDPTGKRLLWLAIGLLVVGGVLVQKAAKIEV